MTQDKHSVEQAAADQLERLAVEIQNWRDNKKYRTEPIPLSLLNEAQKLSQHYSSNHIQSRLGITKVQMDKIDAIQKSSPEATEPEFLKFVSHSNPVSSKPQTKELNIEVTTAQGMTITFSGLPDQKSTGRYSKAD